MLSIAVVCEAAADRRTGCDLADRVVCAEVEWIEEETLPHLRQWRGLNPGDSHLLWTEIPALTKLHNIKVHGHFDGKRAAPDAHTALKALRLLYTAALRPDAIVLLRDDDRDTERRKGLEQARKAFNVGVKVVFGLAHTKRECWVIAGFEPQNEQERNRLSALREQLGFDPREKAGELTAKHSSAKRNAKRVLGRLTGGDPDRGADCWKKTDLRILVARGRNTGLAQYLDEVNNILVRLFTSRPDL